ncbi:MAG: hypothetical protein PWP65_2 [Clostridia bacterium]|nr:hypothetical protein [Clostridia bacterium]
MLNFGVKIIIAVSFLVLTIGKVTPAAAAPPVITIYEPDNGEVIKSDEVQVRGRVEDADEDGLWINGERVGFSSSGRFYHTVTLRKGENTITVSARNGDGTTTETVRVTTDYQPAIEIEWPTDGMNLRNNYVWVRGTVENTREDGLEINGQKVPLGQSSSFTCKLNLKPGKNTITVKAANKLEAVSERITVTYTPNAEIGSKYELSVPDKGVKTSLFNDFLQVEIPPGALPIDSVLTFSVADPLTLPPPPPWRATASRAFSFYGAELTAPITLALKYGPEILPANLSRLAVCRYVQERATWQPLGGRVDARKGLISLAVDRPGTYMAMVFFGTMDDIINAPEREAIEILLAKGIANGISPTRFGPRDPVTRAQAAAFLARALNLPARPPKYNSFSDVPPDHWAYLPVEAVARAGLMYGTSATTFSPEARITREEAAVILSRAAGLPPAGEQQEAAILRYFADRDEISPFARGSLAALLQAKLWPLATQARANTGPISGMPETYFKPKAALTRAEMATLLVTLLREKKML